jgi:catechol 2,3-dioxygenase-like lactoylglutathione lyase family enzyme
MWPMRLNHVTLIVSDFELSKAFYAALGLVQIVDTPPRYARFRAPDGDATLSIEVDDAVQGEPGAAQLFFECPDIDNRYADLKAKGFEFEQEPTDMFYLWREARLRDPDGHDIRLFKENAPDVRLNPPWKIKES